MTEARKTFHRLVGTWLGETPLEGKTRRFLITRRIDGTFDVRFRDYAGKELVHE